MIPSPTWYKRVLEKLPGRHPSITGMLRWFDTTHLPPQLAEVVSPFAEVAFVVARDLKGPHATVALRKLFEAKNAAVCACIEGAESGVGG